MATSSQVKTGLDNISDVIVAQRAILKNVVQQAVSVGVELDGLAMTYADVIATIEAYPANSTDAFEAVSASEFNKMVAEYTALRQNVTTITSFDLSK